MVFHGSRGGVWIGNDVMRLKDWAGALIAASVCVARVEEIVSCASFRVVWRKELRTTHTTARTKGGPKAQHMGSTWETAFGGV